MAKGRHTNPDSRGGQGGAVRLPNGTFAPGHSGNVNGVPRWLKDFRDAFGEKSGAKAEKVLNKILDRALNTDVLEAVLESNASDEAKLAAEKRILDRMGQGGTAADIVLKYLVPKPTAPQEVTVTEKRDAFAGLSAAELVELAKHKPEEGT